MTSRKEIGSSTHSKVKLLPTNTLEGSRVQVLIYVLVFAAAPNFDGRVILIRREPARWGVLFRTTNGKSSCLHINSSIQSRQRTCDADRLSRCALNRIQDQRTMAICSVIPTSLGPGSQIYVRQHILPWPTGCSSCCVPLDLTVRNGSADIVDASTMELVAIVSLGGAFVPNGFHAFWVDAAQYKDGAQRFEGLQPEPESDALPKIGELDWTGEVASKVAKL
eukprot:COSAG02_NODE_6164_length_3755_cov_1.862418_2_plen_222_part_00